MGKEIHDPRALLGGIALLLIGLILSVIFVFHMHSENFGRGILISRWWWEIVLNFQILCLALMWFCHHNRILYAQGWWRVRAVVHFVAGMVLISYPVGIMIVGAYLDWFRDVPPVPHVRLLIIAAFALWGVGNIIVPLIVWLLVRGEDKSGANKPIDKDFYAWAGAFWPAFIAVCLAGFSFYTNWRWLFAFTPFFLYLQGALPYFRKARHASPRDANI